MRYLPYEGESRLTHFFCSQSRSLDADRYDDATGCFTSASIFVAFDAIARAFASPKGKDADCAEDANGEGTKEEEKEKKIRLNLDGRSPLSVVLASGSMDTGTQLSVGVVAANSEEKEEKGDADHEVVARESKTLAGSYLDANPVGVITVPHASFGGISLAKLSETFLIADPRVAQARHSVISYLDSLPSPEGGKVSE